MTVIDKNKLKSPPIELLKNKALFLDFDGTLVELAARPEDVIVEPAVYQMLSNLNMALDKRIALVSGRSVHILRTAFAIDPAIAVAGSHGNEIALSGEDAPKPSASLAPLIAELEAFAKPYEGLLVEPKSMGVGLHFRQAPDLEMLCKERAFALADKYSLKVQAGKMLFEIYSGNEDKGSAIKKLCAMQPFIDSAPIFIGDDKTDEHGFSAVAEMGGAGILVGPQRDTAALYRLDDVSSVHNWLSSALKAMNYKG